MWRVCRVNLGVGVYVIKLATTCGLVSDHDMPLDAEFTTEEIAAAVEEASRKGKHVSAHAYGGPGLTNAVRAGVLSIEHGGFLSQEQASLMAQSGCFLLPTLPAMPARLRWGEEGALPPTPCENMPDLALVI